MNRMVEFWSKKRYLYFIGSLFLFFTAFLSKTNATTVIVQSGGTTGYQTLDAAFSAIQNHISIDTISIVPVGNVAYDLTNDISEASNKNKLVIIGSVTEPDKFPVVNIKLTAGLNTFFNKDTVSFKRISLTGTAKFDYGLSNNGVTFDQCVIHDFTSKFISFNGSNTPKINFTNCLFANNKDTIFQINYSNQGPYLEILNCSFDNNKAIFSKDESNNANIVIANCIFSNNTTAFPSGTNLKKKTSYCYVPIDTAGAGFLGFCKKIPSTDTIYQINPRTTTPPSSWKLRSGTGAIGMGTSSLARVPTVDIAGNSRVAPYDVGCWKYEVGPITITKQPKSDTVITGYSDSFSVVIANKTGATYSWFRVGKTDTLYKKETYQYSAVDSMDGFRYYCDIVNGSNTKRTDTVTLRVISKPVITKNLSDTSVATKTKAQFTIVATGLNLSYHWFKDSIEVTTLDTTKATYTIDTVTKTPTTIYCIVRNPAGQIVSNTAKLTIGTDIPQITTQPNDVAVLQNATAIFTVKATGLPPLEYAWYKTTDTLDKISNAAACTLSNVQFADTGFYYCKVTSTLSGKSNKSTSALLKIISKPVITSPPQLTIETQLGKSASFSVKVDGVVSNVKWYKKGSETAISDANSLTFAIQAVKAADQGDYYCIVSNAADSDTSKVFHLVITIPNPLSFVLIKPIQDSLTLKIKGINSLDSTTESIITSFGVGNDLTTITIPLKDFPPKGTDSLEYIIKNDLFKGYKSTISWNLYVKTTAGSHSDTVKQSVVVGQDPPDNQLTLETVSVEASEVTLGLKNSDGIDSVRVWYGLNQIPLLYSYDSLSNISYGNVKLKHMDVGGTVSQITITNLSDTTHYYFGFQIKKAGLWSYITESSRIDELTLKSSSNTIPNGINIKKSEYDPLKHTITVTYTIDTSGIGNSIPLIGSRIGIQNIDIVPDSAVTIPKLNHTDENIYTFNCGDTIHFNTVYYVNLFVKARNSSIWSGLTDSSRNTVLTGSPDWASVRYFTKNGGDTVTCFMDSVRIWKGPQWSNDDPVSDTLEYQKISDLTIPNGCTIVSSAFKFKNPQSSSKIYFGLTINKNLLGSSQAKDANLYEYDSVKKRWMVVSYEHEPIIGNDVLVLSDTIDPPEHRGVLALMVDNAQPQIDITSDTVSVVSPSADINDIIKITDNISNVQATLLTGKGFDTLHLESSVIVEDSSPKTYQIKDTSIDLYSGVRALLIVKDGRFTETVNLSRMVKTKPKNLTAVENVWTPLFTRAVLDSGYIKFLFDSLAGPQKQYDNTKFRIFKWNFATKDNIAYGGKWIEYGETQNNDSLFSLSPGSLLWLKTNAPKTIDFGNGKTLPLKKSYEITLKAKSYTDLVVPFDFGTNGIKIHDILVETGEEYQNYLCFFKWKKNAANNHYITEPFHYSGNSATDFPDRNMISGTTDIYTVYNKSDNDIVLKFPPFPSVMSTYKPPLNKKQSDGSWNLTLNAKTTLNEEISPIYCGYSSSSTMGKIAIPLPPSFSKTAMSFYDEGLSSGMLFSNEKSDGYSFCCKFSNGEQNAQTLLCTVANQQVPSGMNVMVYNATTGELEGVMSKGFTVNVDGGASTQRWLLVGNDAFIEKFIRLNRSSEFALIQTYPNPFRGVLNVKFNLPVEGVNTVNFMLFDAIGRMVWNSKMDSQLHPGFNTFVYQTKGSNTKKMASGTYILRVIAKNEKGKDVFMKETKLMFLP